MKCFMRVLSGSKAVFWNSLAEHEIISLKYDSVDHCFPKTGKTGSQEIFWGVVLVACFPEVYK